MFVKTPRSRFIATLLMTFIMLVQQLYGKDCNKYHENIGIPVFLYTQMSVLSFEHGIRNQS